MKQLKLLAVALVAVSSAACKQKSTYVHLTLLPASAEPSGITSVELDLSLGAETATTTLREPSGGPIHFPTDVTLLVGHGDGQLSITAIARATSGTELDRGVTTATVAAKTITQVGVQLDGGKANLVPAEPTKSFGQVPQGSASPVNLTFLNAGYKTSGRLSLALAGADATQFMLDGSVDTCTGQTLQPSATCVVSVVFQPHALGTFAGAVVLSGTPGGTATVALTGTAVQYFQLSLATGGSGQGSLSPSPAGAFCGANCQAYPVGTVVQVTATTQPGSRFAGYTGACSSNPCSVTMAANQSVTATFVQQYVLSVATVGNGSGVVTGDVIKCGAGMNTCSLAFDSGTVVTLSASASANSTFTGWTGACSGVGSCSVTMSSPVSVDAGFDPSYTASGSWNCATGTNCQDVYDFDLTAGTTVRIAVSGVTGSSVLRLAAFVPGQSLSSNNLLTGVTSDRSCGSSPASQNAGDNVEFYATTAGTYRIAVARDWGKSAGASGNYLFTVSTDLVMTPKGLSAGNVASGATGSQCGYTWVVSDKWTCGANCEGVFDFTTLVATPLTVTVSNVTGSSVLRLATFTGSSLSSTNELNNLLSDRKCVGQNAGDTITSSNLSPGRQRVSVGRDYGASAGTTGTYTLTVTTASTPLVPLGNTGENLPSGLTATSCP